MDPFRFTTLAHATHDFCNPVAAATLDRFVESLGLAPGARVLDAGCGKAELLIRVARRWQACGIGVDTNPAFLAEARARASGRVRLGPPDVVGGSVELIEAEVAAVELAPASFDLVLCIGSTHVFGPLPVALAALGGLVRADGQLLFGHGYWQREPAPEYLDGFGATRDELGTHEDNLAALAAAGFEPLESALSGPADWDQYEIPYAENIERYFAGPGFAGCPPDDPDREAFLERSRTWHRLYRVWGRDTMGFALYRARRR